MFIRQKILLNEEYSKKFLSKEGIQLRNEFLEKKEKSKIKEYIKQNLKEFEEPKIVKKDENDNDTEILENFLG